MTSEGRIKDCWFYQPTFDSFILKNQLTSLQSTDKFTEPYNEQLLNYYI